MSSTTEQARAARRVRHAAIRAEVAQEEADTAEEEAIEKAATLDVPLHLRIDAALDAQLRAWATEQHIPTSALVRRLLRHAVSELDAPGLTTAEVESIARRVTREELNHR